MTPRIGSKENEKLRPGQLKTRLSGGAACLPRAEAESNPATSTESPSATSFIRYKASAAGRFAGPL
jgi:hypothetical protein